MIKSFIFAILSSSDMASEPMWSVGVPRIAAATSSPTVGSSLPAPPSIGGDCGGGGPGDFGMGGAR